MVKKRLAGLFFLLLVTVACGPTVKQPPTTISFYLEGSDNFLFTPKSFTAPTGSTIDLTFKNSGVIIHNVALVAYDTDPLMVTDSEAIDNIHTEKIAGGETAHYRFTAPAAGTYQYVCTVPGHAAGGMIGTLVVTP